MIFFKIIMRKIENEKNKSNTEKHMYRKSTERLYQTSEENAYVAVIDMSELTCTLVAAVKAEMAHTYTATLLVEEFNKITEENFTIKNHMEISLGQFKRFLRRAEHEEYIEDNDKIVSELKLDCDYRCKELIANNVSRTQIEELSYELLYDSSMKSEIERIYQVRNDSEKLHHPVHYIIRSDNEDDYRQIIDCLLSALYENNRIFSKRYSEIEVYDRMDNGRLDLIKLYSLHRGGTVVLKVLPSRGAESAYETDRLCDHIERLGRVINKFNQDVLTLFVLPQVCEKEIEAIYKNTDPIFIEIAPENASGERAQEYLNYKAQKAAVTATDSLYNGIDNEKSFSSYELSEHFTNWYSNHVRTEMYPQYAEIKKQKIAPQKDSHYGKALKELNEMIGLQNAKKIIYSALDYYKVQKMYKKLGKRVDTPSMHMVFSGNPGTAKTTVARLFAQILKDNDVIINGRLVEVGRADLIGKYVGHTAPLVKQAFEKAAGGILFIDEAYSLLDDKDGMYGDEAINTIVQEMENRRNETIVIFAGYPNEMKAFLNRNPGLKSRIAFQVPFDDYSPEELVEITKLIAKKKENIIGALAIDKLSEIYADAVKIRDFGNGRYVRNIVEKAEMNRASRLAKLSFDEVTKEMLETFIPEDFEMDKKQIKDEKRIGFL